MNNKTNFICMKSNNECVHASKGYRAYFILDCLRQSISNSVHLYSICVDKYINTKNIIG